LTGNPNRKFDSLSPQFVVLCGPIKSESRIAIDSKRTISTPLLQRL
jgi:hypothetical protein